MCISLIFLSNKLCDPHVQRTMRLPIEFISFAITRGRIYNNPQMNDTFNLPLTWKNTEDVVYGGLFLLNDMDYYARTLDAYQMCSLATLRRNHVLDTQHRVIQQVTPISFTTVEQLARLQYMERNAVEAQAYIGNIKQPTIARYGKARSRMRIIDSLHKDPLTNLIREVL